MGSMNAMGWVLVAAADPDPTSLWDLLNEFAARTNDEGPGIHGFNPGHVTALGEPLPRWCVHPNSVPSVEFRDNDLHTALLMAATWKAKTMDETDMWRRD